MGVLGTYGVDNKSGSFHFDLPVLDSLNDTATFKLGVIPRDIEKIIGKSIIGYYTHKTNTETFSIPVPLGIIINSEGANIGGVFDDSGVKREISIHSFDLDNDEWEMSITEVE